MSDLDYYRTIASVVAEEIEAAGIRRSSCILAARLTGIALRALGFASVEAMACELNAYSPAYVAMLVAVDGLGRPLAEDELDAFIAAGAWRVMLEFGPAPEGVLDRRHAERPGYEGHVVTLVGRAVLIDPTLAQANRPAKELLLDPALTAVEIDYDAARTEGAYHKSENGTMLRRTLIPGRKDFTRAPDWRLRAEIAPVLGEVFARLEIPMTRWVKAQTAGAR